MSWDEDHTMIWCDVAECDVEEALVDHNPRFTGPPKGWMFVITQWPVDEDTVGHALRSLCRTHSDELTEMFDG